VVVDPTRTIPYAVWLLLGYFRTLPPELEEAARVDGCNRLTALIRIVLPISLPGILTAVIFTVALTIQDFIYPLAFISSSSEKPLSVGIATDLVRGDVFFWQSLMAGALLVGLPIAIAYSLLLDRFVHGITAGAIK
jgi:multiple sugar transport system permease protein